MNIRFLSILSGALIVFALSQSTTANNLKATDLPRIRADVSKDNVQVAEPFQIRVISVLEGRTDPTQFRDIRPVVDIESAPTQSIRWIVWAVGGFVVLVSSAAMVAFNRRQTTPAPTYWALGEINRVERELERQAIDQATGLTQLSMILRDYLELQFEISAQVQTTPELLQILKTQQRLDPAKLERLNHIFESADQVKFAGFKLMSESIQKVIDESRALVRETATLNVSAEKRAAASNQQGGN